jgi:PAS domain S-box-containing protein
VRSLCRADAAIQMSNDLFDAGTFTSPEEAVEFVKNVLESSTEYSIIATDEEGVISLWNEGARRLYGYALSEIVGQSHTVLHPEEDIRDGVPQQMMDRALRDGKWGGTLRRIRKDGSEFNARVVLTPRRTPDEQLAGFLLVSTDVTEHTRLTRELEGTERANAGLEAADLAKNQFLTNMSHELRTPLNAILGFTGTLLMEMAGPLTDEQRKQLRTVQVNGKHLLSLINDLLDLAKIESGKVEVNIEPVGCRDVLQEVVLGMRPLAEEKGIELGLVLPKDDVQVRSDRRALSQILINLTNNAIKFTDEGFVQLEMSQDRSDGAAVARFSVADSGRGIEPEDQKQLFAAFEQIGASTTRHSEGTGLGLYICQRLAALIDGAISFESEFGKGTTFTLELRQ